MRSTRPATPSPHTRTSRAPSRRGSRSAAAAARSAITWRCRRRSGSRRGGARRCSNLIWALGAMAAERVFYGENSTGVGGDVRAATDRAAWMVGACGMAPEYVELRCDDESEDEARERVMKRFQKIGSQIVNRSSSGQLEAGVLRDPTPARHGRAAPRPGLPRRPPPGRGEQGCGRPGRRRARRSGASCTATRSSRLLDAQSLQVPEVDLTADEAWPHL